MSCRIRDGAAYGSSERLQIHSRTMFAVRCEICVIDEAGWGGDLAGDPRLLQVIDAALVSDGLDDCLLSVLLVDDLNSARLHGQHFADPSPTDVMTFPDGSREPACGRLLLGDLAIGVEVAARAGRRRRPDDPAAAQHEEMILYVLHGLLHLLGYDDHDPRDRAEMWTRQRELLAAVGIAIESEPTA